MISKVPPIPPEQLALPPLTPDQQAYLQNLGGYMTSEQIKQCTCTWGGSNRRTPQELAATHELKRHCPIHGHIYK
jgi:hypothetical protein